MTHPVGYPRVRSRAMRARRRARVAVLVLVASVLSGCTLLRAPERPTTPTAPPPAPAARVPSAEELLRLPDAVPRAEPRARLGNPAFYEVAGIRYVVLPDSRGYVERGVASWYGPDFHGERTSTGEPYDMYSMTAAHKTLPLPAYARVTNLKNGRSIVVRINDRGPFKPNRIVDLSYAAALKLDMVREGTTLVEVRTLEPEGTAAIPPPPAAGAIYAQAGAFGVEGNAARLRAQLEQAGIANVAVRRDATGKSELWRVRIGPLANVAEYDALVARLRALGHADVRVASD